MIIRYWKTLAGSMAVVALLFAVVIPNRTRVAGFLDSLDGTQPSPLTAAHLENASFDCLPQVAPFTLSNGGFERVEELDEYRLRTRIGIVAIREAATGALRELIEFGDLNGDAVDDAVIALFRDEGGSGTWIYLVAIVNDGGEPRCAASVELGDRPQINGLQLSDHLIELDLNLHARGDPMVRPSIRKRIQYSLQSGRLVASE